MSHRAHLCGRGRRVEEDGGAVLVEFALLLPLLLLIIVGIIEFGRAFNSQIELTGAAREAARTMAVTSDQTLARNNAISAAAALNPALAPGQIAFSLGTCVGQPANTNVAATITYPFDFIVVSGVPGFGGFADRTMTATGVMRCGG